MQSMAMVLTAFCFTAPTSAITPAPAELAEVRAFAHAKFEAVTPQGAAGPGIAVLANYGPIQRNTRDGNPLKIGKQQFTHGIYCHANSRLRIYLPGPAKFFSANVGIDTNGTWAGGSSVFSVEVKAKKVCRSPVCLRAEGARPLQADLHGATAIDLVVGDAGDNINSDQSDWADATVVLEDGKSIRIGDLPVLASVPELADSSPPFSFNIANQSFPRCAGGWKVERRRQVLDDSKVEHTCTWTDPRTQLVARCVAIEYTDFPVIEWTIHLMNAGTSDTPIIEQVQAIDTDLLGELQATPRLHYNTGDLCTPDSYAPHDEPLAAAKDSRASAWIKQIANTGGRPTQSAFPYFNLAWPTKGTIVVLSWAGQWAVRFGHNQGLGIRVQGGQELTRFKLHPGEQVRGPMSVLLFYDGDWLRGQNLWRRWMVRHNLPRPGGKLVQPMASLCTGNYYPGLMSNAAQEIAFIREHLDHRIPFDNWWQDAGWYPCDGVTWPKTGTWEVDLGRFPKGLREVSDFVHGHGIKSLLWFEPERVHPGTWLVEHHPEWIHGGSKGGLLKLSDPACRAWLTDHIDRFLTEQAIDHYRQDFNIDPLGFWRTADEPDRQGITEIRHIEGYFAYWDELRRRHPDMLIDSCASGGRRNDLETLRRAVPLLRSDYYASPTGQQCQTYGLSLWFPYQGTGTLSYNDKYWMRSSMVAEFSFGPDSRGDTPVDWDHLRRMLSEHQQLGTCFYGDFYPLTPYSLDEDAWMGWQYSLPEKGVGVVQVFRRGASPYESARFLLRDLDPEADYQVRDVDSDKVVTLNGRVLMTDGVPVALPGRNSAVTLLYQR
jgi:alpha-galactosidase